MMSTIDDIIKGRRRPVVIAHRGASHYCHENTMKAFQAAVDMSAEMIEFDVRRAGDGTLVIHHDSDLRGDEIRDMTTGEILERSGSAGYLIPTLFEVLELCKDKIPVDIELKEAGYEQQVLDEILDVLEPDQFIITSVHDSVIRKVKVLRPGTRTGFIISSHPRWQLLTKLFPGFRARRSGADVLVASSKLLKFGFLSTTRNLGLPVWVYTVNDRKELWKRITDGRISGIFSDRPDVALFLRDLHTVGKNPGSRIQEPE
jgi:glycerophosphoryl diester phosphodiesterase